MYAYPAGTSFCSCASSRAALHVGSLFLRNRQPSNAPPLLLSPTGRATRRGPQMQNTLGGTPRHPRSSGATSASIGQTLRYTAGSPLRCGAPSSPHKVLRPCGDPISPLGTGCAVPKRGLNGAYRVSATHFYRLPRWSAEWRTTTPVLPLSLQCRAASLSRSHCSCRSPRNCRCIRHRRRSNSLPLRGGGLRGKWVNTFGTAALNAHSTQHLPSARVRQAESGIGTPSPASGEGRERGQMRPRHLISTV